MRDTKKYAVDKALYELKGGAARDVVHQIGTAEHKLWAERMKTAMRQAGKSNFGIEVPLTDAKGNGVRLDFVDYDTHTIVDRKPIKYGQLAKAVVAANTDQRAKHCSAYQQTTGQAPNAYVYSLYPSATGGEIPRPYTAVVKPDRRGGERVQVFDREGRLIEGFKTNASRQTSGHFVCEHLGEGTLVTKLDRANRPIGSVYKEQRGGTTLIATYDRKGNLIGVAETKSDDRGNKQVTRADPRTGTKTRYAVDSKGTIVAPPERTSGARQPAKPDARAGAQGSQKAASPATTVGAGLQTLQSLGARIAASFRSGR
jgi:hypothetical protein